MQEAVPKEAVLEVFEWIGAISNHVARLDPR